MGNSKLTICTTYYTSKTEIGKCIYENKEYFYKKINGTKYNDKTGYSQSKKFFKVPSVRKEYKEYVIYEYIKDFEDKTINDYLYGKAPIMNIDNILHSYNISINKSLKCIDENKCNSKKYFYDRLPMVYENINNLKNEYIVINNVQYNIKKILSEIITQISKEKKLYSFITQGDPTDTNITTTGYFTDFENGGYNSILGEISIFFVSLFSHGRYFYPKYNSKAYVVNNCIIDTYDKYCLSINYEIKDNIIFINNFNYNLPLKNKELLLNYLNVYKDNNSYKKYEKDFSLLKYYICMRLLTPINIDKMEEKDKNTILTLAVTLYNDINDINCLYNFINNM